MSDAPLADQPRELFCGVGAVAGMAPARDLACVTEWDIEAAKLDQEAQMFDVRLAVLAVVVVPPRGRREPARSLVEANGIG